MKQGVLAVALMLGVVGGASSVQAVERVSLATPQIASQSVSMEGSQLLALGDQSQGAVMGHGTPVKAAKHVKGPKKKVAQAMEQKKAKKVNKSKNVKNKKAAAGMDGGTAVK